MKKVLKQVEKSIVYNMSAEVVAALDNVMNDEGHNTMTKAIDACILDRKRIIEALREEESASNKIYHQKMEIENSMTKFVQFIDFCNKYTKRS